MVGSRDPRVKHLGLLPLSGTETLNILNLVDGLSTASLSN